MTWQGKYVESSPTFKSAESILEVGAGAFKTSNWLAKRHPDRRFVAVDFEISNKACEILTDTPRNLTVLKHDARDLRILSENQFDLVWSVAVMEHIRELEAHLNEVERVLKLGGSCIWWQS